MPDPLTVLKLVALTDPAYEDARLEEYRRLEALEQLALIVAEYGEARVLRWVKSQAAMQSGTGGT